MKKKIAKMNNIFFFFTCKKLREKTSKVKGLILDIRGKETKEERKQSEERIIA